MVTCQHLFRAEGEVDVVRPRRLPRPGEPPSEFMFDYLCYFQTSTFFCSKEIMLRIPFTKGFRSSRISTGSCGRCVTLLPSLWLWPTALDLPCAREPDKRYQRLEVEGQGRLGAREPALDGQTRLFAVYCRFVRRTCCLGTAGVRGLWRLFYECAIVGSPTPLLLLLLFGMIV